ncbi:MAG: hypothetical protein ABSG46_18855 [Candidatus Binataceae bacterium]|jgi:hypothetical protein
MPHLFDASTVYPPLWILFGFVSGFFTERANNRTWKVAWAIAVVLLAILAWQSGIQQEKAQAQQAQREEELRESQQQLNMAFAQIAVFLKLPPGSPHQMIMQRMEARSSARVAPP